jgi:hypothetical protein
MRVFATARAMVASAMFCVTAGMLAVGPNAVLGQEKADRKPSTEISDSAKGGFAAVVTLAPMEKLLRDLNFFLSAIGQEAQGAMVLGMVPMFTKGIDNKLPIAVMVDAQTSEGTPGVLVALPIADVEAFLKGLEAQNYITSEKQDDGSFAVLVQGQTLFIRNSGVYAFGSNQQSLIEDLPGDPAPLLAGMGEKYDLGIRVNMQAIPEGMRDGVIEQIKQGFDQAIASATDEQKPMMEQSRAQIDQMALLAKDLDVLQFGWNIDPVKKNTYLEYQMTAVSGTKLASDMEDQKVLPTQFAGFRMPQAAGMFHFSSSIPSSSVDSVKQSLPMLVNQLKGEIKKKAPADKQKKLDQAVDAIYDEIVKTIEQGVSNGGLIVKTDDNVLQIGFGGRVASGNNLAKIVQDLAKEVPADANGPKFSFNVGKHKGVDLHTISVPIPPGDASGIKILGKEATVAIGTADKAVYLMLGKNSLELLKSTIDADQKGTAAIDYPMMEMQVHALPIMEFAQWVEPNPMLEAILGQVSKSADSDRLMMSSEKIPNGAAGRLTLEEGLLKIIGVASMMGTQNAGQAN